MVSASAWSNQSLEEVPHLTVLGIVLVAGGLQQFEQELSLQAAERRVDPEAVPERGRERERRTEPLFQIPSFDVPELLVEFLGIGRHVEITEASGHVDAEFGPGVGFAGPAGRQRRLQSTDRPQPLPDAEAGTRDLVNLPGVIPPHCPARDTDVANDPVIAPGRGHGSEVGQLDEGLRGQVPLVARAEGTLAFQGPGHDLECV